MAENSDTVSGEGRDGLSDSGMSEEEIDYLDFDVELDEGVRDVFSIRDTTEDKMLFTIMLANAFVTWYLGGFIPNYFYIWHTLKFVALISYRWYDYKRTGQHYFFFDFCYFTNTLVLVYVWSPWKLGGLFPVVHAFSLGPVLFGLVVFRNSIVPHSMDKMTSVFIHSSPIATVCGLKWYSTVDQGFELCHNATSVGIDGCDHVGWRELLLWPFLIYLLWQIIYAFIMFKWKAKRIKERNYLTAYTYMAERKSALYNLYNMYGPKYRKVIFLASQIVYTMLGLLSAYLAYFSIWYTRFIVIVMVLIACYNGATYYIDVVGRMYYVKQHEKTKSS